MALVRAQGIPQSNNPNSSVAYYASWDASRDNNGNGERNLGGSDGIPIPVISIPQAPAGNYVVNWRGWVSAAERCSLSLNAFGDSNTISPWFNDGIDLNFTEGISLSSQGNITVYCQSSSGDMMETKASLTAIKINTLNQFVN